MVSISSVFGCSPTDPLDHRSGKHYIAVEGPVGDLYRLYFESGHDSADDTFDVLLSLDCANLPNSGYSCPYLRLMNSFEFGGLWEAVSFDYYEYGEIPPNSGFPENPAPGWKVRISGTKVWVCTTCLTDDGNLDLISLSGGRESVAFVWDPEDTLAAYVEATRPDNQPQGCPRVLRLSIAHPCRSGDLVDLDALQRRRYADLRASGGSDGISSHPGLVAAGSPGRRHQADHGGRCSLRGHHRGTRRLS